MTAPAAVLAIIDVLAVLVVRFVLLVHVALAALVSLVVINRTFALPLSAGVVLIVLVGLVVPMVGVVLLVFDMRHAFKMGEECSLTLSSSFSSQRRLESRSVCTSKGIRRKQMKAAPLAGRSRNAYGR